MHGFWTLWNKICVASSWSFPLMFEIVSAVWSATLNLQMDDDFHGQTCTLAPFKNGKCLVRPCIFPVLNNGNHQITQKHYRTLHQSSLLAKYPSFHGWIQAVTHGKSTPSLVVGRNRQASAPAFRGSLAVRSRAFRRPFAAGPTWRSPCMAGNIYKIAENSSIFWINNW